MLETTSVSRGAKFTIIDRLALRPWSRYKRKRLLARYAQRITVRSTGTNVFLNTWLPFFVPRQYKLSAGLISDFAGRKKRKKTSMAGLELGYMFGMKLQQTSIRGLSYIFKGHGAQKRGVVGGLRRQGFIGFILTDPTPIAHNGTRAFRARRL